jgi:hypothetical protein
VIDGLATEDERLLTVAAAVHVGAGRVKMTAAALRGPNIILWGGILDATAGEEDDPLRSATLIGIDPGRSLAA